MAPDTQPAPSIQSPETASVAPEKIGELSPVTTAQPVQLVQTQASDQQSSTPLAAPSTAVPSNDNPQIADDVDVIEKEWVDKAKKIVSATRDDPHMQEKEVSKLQADYLLKRYNKQTKLGG